jgi:phosphoserine phosphatase RsbU/P
MTLGAVAPELVGEPFAYHLARGTWAPSPAVEIHLELPALPTAPSSGRAAAADLLALVVTPQALADTMLVVSELVTNAVRHAAPGPAAVVELYLAVAADQIRAEVCDSGDGFRVEPVVVADLGATGGRGLLLVNRFASRWGASTDAGHTVWFELDR